jgi:glycosyltransferase involved in cell wall biosynthesis
MGHRAPGVELTPIPPDEPAGRVSASVVVCTRDRAAPLRRCLDALDEQLPIAGAIEVVVVDNGSSDGTAALLAEWSAAAPMRRRTLLEPTPGLSQARNTGVAAARHDVVLFIDDDAVAPRGWVAAHIAAYERDPTIAAVGGPVVLAWPSGRPAWASRRLEHWWSALDLGDEAVPYPGPHGPYGTNMSVRRSTITAVGGFRTSLGRRGRDLLSGEEAALWAAVWAAGGVIRYEPAALVVHEVVADKLGRAWIVRRAVAQGRTNARLAAMDGPRPRRAVAQAVREDARFALAQSSAVAQGVRSKQTTSSDVLDDLARGLGHATSVIEHVRLRALDALRVRWR